ncbi:MAG: GNAT family N-acetyltransferase, partial [Saprospiraceae bacterium]|nr:GNAT family N-acetyltransferase [Saprospiraceae bacterium]
MANHKSYLFTSARLGFRNWLATDLEEMAAINADKAVMEFFPKVATKEETLNFIHRMQQQLTNKGFCYFAVDLLESHEFIGFIGLFEQTYEAHFTPCVDIGWRLRKTAWNQGFATEGAARCLEYAFQDLNLQKVVAVAPKINVRSEQVMKKIGMKKSGEFEHPLLGDCERLRDCV